MKSKNVAYSKHVLERMESRGISKAIVSKIIEFPDSILKEEPCISIHQKKFADGKNNYLVRVFINICKTPPLIITTYKTSKVDKYEN